MTSRALRDLGRAFLALFTLVGAVFLARVLYDYVLLPLLDDTLFYGDSPTASSLPLTLAAYPELVALGFILLVIALITFLRRIEP